MILDLNRSLNSKNEVTCYVNMAVGRLVGCGLMWLQSPLKFFTFLLLLASVLFLNWDGESVNQLSAESFSVQYAFIGFNPSRIVSSMRPNTRRKHYLLSRLPYAADNSRNFQLTRRVILSGDVEVNPGPNDDIAQRKRKQTNVQCKGKTNVGVKICEWSINRLTNSKFEQIRHFLTSSHPEIDVLFLIETFLKPIVPELVFEIPGYVISTERTDPE